jgi:uncharacterized protein
LRFTIRSKPEKLCAQCYEPQNRRFNLSVDAFDAFIVTGGFPNLLNRWRHGQTLKQFLASQLVTSTEVLSIVGERMMGAEFPVDSQARLVLTAIGSGAPTFTTTGPKPDWPQHRSTVHSSSSRRSVPLRSNNRRRVGRVAAKRDTGSRTRTWHSGRVSSSQRCPCSTGGRSQQVQEYIVSQWPDYRGQAIEPIVRESVSRLLPIDGVDAHTVASYWTRDGRTEVDVVGINGNGSKRRVSFIGSIKWRQRRPFSGTDASALAAQLAMVPGVDDRTVLLAVSSSGFEVRGVPITLGPDELLQAWST